MKKIKVFDSKDELDQALATEPIRRLRIGDTLVAIAKVEEGYKAFELLCPHQKQALNKGKITEYGEVVCPLHEYRFDLDSGRESKQRSRDLIIYDLKIKNQGVHIILPD